MKSELDRDFFEQASVIAKSLGNGRRMQLIELLTHGEKSVERLALSLDIGITSVSSHLQVLKNAGILHSRREGVKIYYSVADKSVSLLLDHVKNMTASMAHRDVVESLKLPTERVISLHQLVAKMDQSDCTLIDVRPRDEYDTFHIPRAVSIPIEDVHTWALRENAPRTVIIYCRGIYCLLSATAMKTLEERGYECFVYTHGISEWRGAGFPLEGRAA